MASYGTYFLKALKNPVALVLVGGLAAISLVSMNPLPLVIGLAGEALFVGGAPLLPAWRRRVDGHEVSRAIEAAADQTRAQLDALPAAEQQRYRRLEQTAAAVRDNYAQYSQASRDFLTQAATRIDDMLDRYLRMLLAKDSYAKHLAAHSADELAARVSTLDTEIAQADDRLREVKGRQREVLAQRLERLRKAESDSALLEAQLSTLEEMVMLMKEQAITMKEPEEITAQLDSLMGEIENTESTVSAIETSVEVAFDKQLRKLEAES